MGGKRHEIHTITFFNAMLGSGFAIDGTFQSSVLLPLQLLPLHPKRQFLLLLRFPRTLLVYKEQTLNFPP
jgi:hypothetical protein